MILIKHAYDPPSKEDGKRILVDRLWPRGLSKEKIHIDQWLKEIAPSHELRKWFNHDASKWDEFQKRYLKELDDHKEELDSLLKQAQSGTITLLYATKEKEHNNAVVLQHYLKTLLS
ncbi:MAG: DUF488 domain-containing protein [Sphaerochaetaceae bacterium]|jgi:uncharacterized protein YeaO (DUF488 family)